MQDPIKMVRHIRNTGLRPYRSDKGPQSIGAAAFISTLFSLDQKPLTNTLKDKIRRNRLVERLY